MDIRINSEDMTLTWSSQGDVPNVTTGTHYKVDFLQNVAGKSRKAGPFAGFPENNRSLSIDSRMK